MHRVSEPGQDAANHTSTVHTEEVAAEQVDPLDCQEQHPRYWCSMEEELR